MSETTKSHARKQSDNNNTERVIIKGKTFKIDKDAFNDLEVLEALSELENGNSLVLPKLIKKIVGSENYTRMLSVLKDEKDRVPIESVADLFVKLSEKLAPKS
jgi:hypothetical protein